MKRNEAVKPKGATCLSEEEKARIHALRVAGVSYAKIARELGRAKGTVMSGAKARVDPVWIYKDWLERNK